MLASFPAHGSSKPLAIPFTPLGREGLKMAVEVHETLVVECTFSTKARCHDMVSAQGLVVVQGLAAAEAHASLFLGKDLLPTGKLGMSTRAPPFPVVLEGRIIWR